MEISRAIILKTFYFLEEEYYYTPVYREGEGNIFIESFEVEYTNEIRRRNIRISYTKGKVYQDIVYNFNASITRIPYAGNEDYFSLSNYLDSLGKDFNTSMDNEFDETKAEEILGKIAEALKEHASKIIEGSVWLETYYPRKD